MRKFLILVFIAALSLLDLYYFVRGDSCMDSGGCWDEVSSKCRESEKYAQLLCHRSRFDLCNTRNLCEKGFTCISHEKLESPQCIPESDICIYFCESNKCNILESYPSQVTCN